MPREAKSLCVDDLRHAEYYGMQPVFDELYRKSKNGEIFTNLMEIILRRENILLACCAPGLIIFSPSKIEPP